LLLPDKPFSDEDPSLADLRSSLRALLGTLSYAQLVHIPPHLDLNPSPSAPSYDEVKAEVLALAAPPPRPPYPPAGPPAGASPAELAAQQKKLTPPHKPPASQAIFDDTVAALKKWNKRREQELALEWMDEAGVEVLWSTRCGEPGCSSCDHPGAELWEADEEKDK
jgi:hypothetical protein